ncbi:hypothetical protein OG982_30130 [Streptomyces sp. NBC_01551]|uniref:hypothetical protein n=1 Tax=Streptomyces sp. NBC_01551 TaxID=2975876 RepID=UPI00224ED3BD|nr:hypothetical protein [Streptomyces sp. NBC_01551]MCX4529903.1 hypothetical protein [Streptomyces sp. NBC_01551]
MSVVLDILTGSFAELLGGVLLLLVLAAWSRRHWRSRTSAPVPASVCASGPPPRQAQRYTLLGTHSPHGGPVQIVSGRPPGTVYTHCGEGRPRRFELTDVALSDGTHVAEPLDRYV